MNSSSKVITTQPIVSYLDKDKTYKSSKNEVNHHKNSCEKCVTCNSTSERCPVKCSEFGDLFKLYEDNVNGSKKCGLYSSCCFPVTLIFNTLFCGSCTLYNVSRNKCANNKESKNYLC